MLNNFIGFTVVAVIALLPLMWRVWHDRAAERALRIRAEVDGAVRRALGGDSFVAVDVTPRLLGRPGQVILSTPSGWGDLVQLALPSVLDRVPANYELVVRPGDGPTRGHRERQIAHATA